MACRVIEKTGICDGCGFKMHLSIYRDRWLCRGCLIGSEIPPRLEDHVRGGCALADRGRMDGAAPRDMSWGSKFHRDLGAAMKREGWEMHDAKTIMWAGHAEAKAKQVERWEAEGEAE